MSGEPGSEGRAAGQRAKRRPAAAETRWSPGFVRAALLSTLTIGTVFGAASLLVIHSGRAAGWVNPAAHATAQLFGFVFLLAAGLALDSVQARRSAITRAILPVTLLGVCARALAQFVQRGGWFGALGLVGAVALTAGVALAGVALWASREREAVGPEAGGTAVAPVLGAMRGGGMPERSCLRPWLVFGAVGWFAAAALLLIGAVEAAWTGDAFAAIAWNEPAYRAALFGGGLFWVIGLGDLEVHVLQGLRPARVGAAVAAALLVAGAVGEQRFALAQAHGMTLAGWALLALSCGWSLIGSGVMRRWPRPQHERAGVLIGMAARHRADSGRGGSGRAGDAGFVANSAWAFASLALFVALTVLHVVLDVRGGSNHLILDAARHAFSIGFVMLLAFESACGIVPRVRGTRLFWAESRELAAGLIAASVMMRVLEVGAGMGATWMLTFSGASGVLGMVGVIVYSIMLWGTVGDDARRRINGRTSVVELLERHPESLSALLKHGFTPLQSELARRALARTITLEQACRLRRQDLRAVLRDVRSIVRDE